MISVRVRVIPWLSDLLPGGSLAAAWTETVTVPEGATVADVISLLIATYPPLGAKVWDPARSALRPGVNALFDGRVLERQGGLSRRVEAGQELTLVPAYSGG